MANQAELYHRMNRGQLENGHALMDYAAPKPGERVLDIGCGTGELTYLLARKVGEQGHVLALDPDLARLKLAQENQPEDIANIRWGNHPFTQEAIQSELEFDLVYSNYVFHWFSDPQTNIALMAQSLKPGGRFAIQYVYDGPECARQVLDMLNKPSLLKMTDPSLWLAFFEQAGLTYENKTDTTKYYHKDLDDFLMWFEATSHGKVKPDHLTEQQKDTLKRKYPGELWIDHPTHRIVGFKP